MYKGNNFVTEKALYLLTKFLIFISVASKSKKYIMIILYDR